MKSIKKQLTAGVRVAATLKGISRTRTVLLQGNVYGRTVSRTAKITMNEKHA